MVAKKHATLLLFAPLFAIAFALLLGMYQRHKIVNNTDYEYCFLDKQQACTWAGHAGAVQRNFKGDSISVMRHQTVHLKS